MEGLGSELMFEIVRHFIICRGEQNCFFFDPRINLDDHGIKLIEI